MKFLSFNIILAVFAVFAVSAFSEALESTVREVYSLAGTNSTYLQHVNATKLGAGHGNPAPNLDVQTAGSWDPTDFSTPEEFDYYREKGHWLQCLLMMTDEEAGNALPDPFGRTPKSASSQWQGPLWSEIPQWGWMEGELDQETHAGFENSNPETTHRIQSALEGIGVSYKHRDAGGNNVAFDLNHFDEDLVDDYGETGYAEHKYYVDGREYQGTGAFNIFTLNPTEGVIFAQNLKSPSFAAREYWRRQVSDAELPRLRATSDIMAAYWLRHNPNPQNLRFWFVNHVVNEDTVPLIALILHNTHTEQSELTVPYWPGALYEAQSTEFQALLGSPLGASMAYFLLQHKAELGIKTVTSATIFRDDDTDPNYPPDIQLLFRIEDVDPGANADEAMKERSWVRRHDVVLARL